MDHGSLLQRLYLEYYPGCPEGRDFVHWSLQEIQQPNTVTPRAEIHMSKIGSIGNPHVNVADDVALLSWHRPEMQVMVWDVEDNAGRERFIVNPSKSHALKYLSNKRKETDEDTFMYNKKNKDKRSATHLGIVWNVNRKPDIEEKINLGRRTAYSLLGTCLLYWIMNSLMILPGGCLYCRQGNTYTKFTTKG